MQHPPEPLLAHLQALEIELHRPAARGDASRLDALLHPDFLEFGRSGRVYTKTQILSSLPSAAQHVPLAADDFVVRRLADDVALLTYRSAPALPDGTPQATTLRSSIWQRTAAGWQMRFHQGTPTGSHETS